MHAIHTPVRRQTRGSVMCMQAQGFAGVRDGEHREVMKGRAQWGDEGQRRQKRLQGCWGLGLNPKP